MILAALDSASLGLGAALATVGMVAATQLGPFLVSWLKGHDHPVAAELAAVVVELEQAREQGKTTTEAIATVIRSPEAQDLLARTRARLAQKAS